MAKTRLSATYTDLRGRLGKQVIARTRNGLVTKSVPRYRYPKNPARELGSMRMQLATAAWNEMSLEQADAWRNYASTLRKIEPVTLQEYSPTAKNAYIGLATKFLQINPEGEIPLWPPTSDFIGDDLVVTCQSIAGGVRFTASAQNSPGAATEILFQKLASVHRSPTKFYKSMLYHTFETGDLELDVPLEAGLYAFSYRFVKVSTGQMTEQLLLGRVAVDG